MDARQEDEERLDDRASSDKEDIKVSIEDMQSFPGTTASRSNSDTMRAFGNLDITRPNEARERPTPTRPQEISDKEYQKLADEIAKTGKIPERLKQALENKEGDRTINIDRLNEMLKDKGLKLRLGQDNNGNPQLDLLKDGFQIIDSAKSPSQERTDMINRLSALATGTWIGNGAFGNVSDIKEALSDLQRMPLDSQDKVMDALEKSLGARGITLWTERTPSTVAGEPDALRMTMNIPVRPGMRDSGYIRLGVSTNGQPEAFMSTGVNDKAIKLDADKALSFISEYANWQNMWGVYGPHVRPRN